MESTGKSYDAVLQDIERQLRSGELKLGDRLPGERALAEEYAISRASVRDAVRILGVLGVVRSNPGSGPEAGTQIIAEPSVGLTNALRLHMASSSLPAKDVIETRVLLECWGAREAARKVRERHDADLGHLRELLWRMDTPGISAEEFHLLDTQFHTELTALAGNAVVESVMGSLRGAIRTYVMEAVERLESWTAVAEGLRAEHRAILEAVSAGDGDEAARLVESHIRGFYAIRRAAMGLG